MSEERRKRQQERGRRGQAVVAEEELIWAGIVVLFIALMRGFWYHSNHRYDGFAKCLASKQAKMYGAVLVSALRGAEGRYSGKRFSMCLRGMRDPRAATEITPRARRQE